MDSFLQRITDEEGRKVSDLIDLEALLRILNERAEQAYGEARSHCDPAQRDKWDLERSAMLDGIGQGFEQAAEVLRALPAVEEKRRCDKCRWWGEPEEAAGKTYAECAGFPPHKTACDFHCALWQPREPHP